MGSMSSANTETVTCGVDLGGTKISIALVRPDGTITARRIIRNHSGLPEDDIVELVADAVREINGSAPVPSRVGVGTAGHVDYRRGLLISNSNLPGFTDYPLAARLSEKIGAEVSVDNDANAQAFAEYRYGAGHGFDNVMFVTVSTGLVAGIIIDGKVYRGVTGTAGEIGHTIVNPESRIRCGCGNFGCLMAHTSGLTLPDVIREKLKDPRVKTAIDFSGLADAQINGELVKEGLEAGDRLCVDVVGEYARYLGLGLHNAVQTINPGVVVVGGGLTGWGDVYMDQVRDTFSRLAAKTLTHPPEIRLSQIGTDAAVIGAAALAMDAGKE